MTECVLYNQIINETFVEKWPAADNLRERESMAIVSYYLHGPLQTQYSPSRSLETDGESALGGGVEQSCEMIGRKMYLVEPILKCIFELNYECLVLLSLAHHPRLVQLHVQGATETKIDVCAQLLGN